MLLAAMTQLMRCLWLVKPNASREDVSTRAIERGMQGT